MPVRQSWKTSCRGIYRRSSTAGIRPPALYPSSTLPPLQANISPAERPEGGGQGGQRSVGQLGPSFFPSFTFLNRGVLGGNRKWENFAPVTGSFYTGKRKFLYRWEIFAPIKLLERQPLLLCPYHWRFASPVEPETSTFRSEIERSKHGGGRRNPKRARQPLSPQGFVER